MGHYLAGNQLVDRGWAASLASSGAGLPGFPLSNLANRDLSKTWRMNGAAGAYVAAQLGTTPTFRVGLVWLVGATLPGTYTVRLATGLGTAGSTLQSTSFNWTGVGPLAMLLPASVAAPIVNVLVPTAGVVEAARLFIADVLDISETFRTDWSQTLIDPNTVQSGGPGGSIAPGKLVTRRGRSFTLYGMTDADVWGQDSATGHGTSFAEICAANGTTGEIALLPRVDRGVMNAAQEIALRNFAVYGTFDRAPGFKSLGQSVPTNLEHGNPSRTDAATEDQLRRLWMSGALGVTAITPNVSVGDGGKIGGGKG